MRARGSAASDAYALEAAREMRCARESAAEGGAVCRCGTACLYTASRLEQLLVPTSVITSQNPDPKQTIGSGVRLNRSWFLGLFDLSVIWILNPDHVGADMSVGEERTDSAGGV
jgi:hypothetical protein